MDSGLDNKIADVRCSTCTSFGFFDKDSHRNLHHQRPTVLPDRSYDDFSKSADRGCLFCDAVRQSFQLLDYVATEMPVKLLLYPESPVELHASDGKDSYQVIEIYPCPTNTGHTYPKVGNDVPRESSLLASVNFLRENFYTCLTEHEEECEVASCLPKRVVDISEPRYRIFEPAADTEGLYATLSYSWGSGGFAMTTTGNYEEMKLGFDGHKLPIAFQDAAALARSLNIQYLWIDTLCIIQDSPTDWEEQAARMGQIYEGAAITIAASLSTDPHSSLFQERDSTHEELELFSGLMGGLMDVVFKARKKITRGIHAKTGRSKNIDPLDTRAWGLQEKLLSRRLIAFTGAELQWTCRASKSCECHSNPLPVHPLSPISAGKTSTNETVRFSKSWSQTVEEYSTRKLKFQKDRFPALSGLANKFGAATGYTFLAGGWKETLLYDLVWQRDMGPVLRSTTWFAPSWSWATSSGAVNFRFARHSYPGSRIEHATLVDLYYDTGGGNQYSRALARSLTIRGHIVAALLRRSSQDSEVYTICIDGAIYSQNKDKRAICEFSIDASIPDYHANETPGTSEQSRSRTQDDALDQEREESVTLLSLYSIHHHRYLYHNFLILARLQDGSNNYRRIGIGSGKIYRGSGCELDFPSEEQHVRPFEWLSIDSKNRGRKFGDIVEQEVCIQ